MFWAGTREMGIKTNATILQTVLHDVWHRFV